MIDIESKIVSYREDTDDYRLCLTREEIDEIKNCRADAIDGINKIIQFIKDNSFNHKLECDSFKAIGSSVVIELLEQLKEKKMTTIGMLRSGNYFMLEGRKYRVGHLINGTNGYVACTDITDEKRVVKRFYIDTTVEALKEQNNEHTRTNTDF